ncbi:MAG: 30S ribosomal protein S5 [bacterium]|nr:30S ribosomal protein S5 [bacterium]
MTEGTTEIQFTVSLNRVTKVVAGGKRFSFNSIVVVGDGSGRVGYGFGKAPDAIQAVEKAKRKALNSMIIVPMNGSTILHEVRGDYGASSVILKPAPPGTGVVAGGAVRAVVEAAGIKDIVAKAIGSTNPVNLVKATFEAISKLKLKNKN